MDEQAIEGYGCSCGFITPDKKEFTTHLMLSSKLEGKGTHKSIGRVNTKTGEVVIPPWSERSLEDKERTKHSKRGASSGNGDKKYQMTDALADAQQIRVVPRVYTMDYSPIMRAAQDAAINLWGWRSEMPLGNFIDTVLYLFFEEKGVTLAGYIVHESLVEKEA